MEEIAKGVPDLPLFECICCVLTVQQHPCPVFLCVLRAGAAMMEATL